MGDVDMTVVSHSDSGGAAFVHEGDTVVVKWLGEVLQGVVVEVKQGKLPPNRRRDHVLVEVTARGAVRRLWYEPDELAGVVAPSSSPANPPV